MGFTYERVKPVGIDISLSSTYRHHEVDNDASGLTGFQDSASIQEYPLGAGNHRIS